MPFIEHDFLVSTKSVIEGILKLIKTLLNYKKTLITLVAVLVFSISLLWHHQKITHNHKKLASESPLVGFQKSAGLQQQFNDIVHKLSHIEATIDHDHIQTELTSITGMLEQLKNQIKDMTAQNNTAILSSAIHNDTQQLSKQIENVLFQLQKSQQKKQVTYLKTQDLPFTISHIDNIQNQNVVTVMYNHTTFPINNGDSLAGWKLINSDFVNQTAELVNTVGQHVIVTLNNASTTESA